MGFLRHAGACHEARDWARGLPLSKVWASCERPDWMIWLVATLLSRQRVVSVVCACARTLLAYVPPGEGRPLAAIEMAERWAGWTVTFKELCGMRRASWAYDVTCNDSDLFVAIGMVGMVVTAAAVPNAYAVATAAEAVEAIATAISSSSGNDYESEMAKLAGLVRGLVSVEELEVGFWEKGGSRWERMPW